jgi:hypothetical protein
MFCLSLQVKQIAGKKQVILSMVNVKSSNPVLIMLVKEPERGHHWNYCHNTGSPEVNLPPTEAHYPFHG